MMSQIPHLQQDWDDQDLQAGGESMGERGLPVACGARHTCSGANPTLESLKCGMACLADLDGHCFRGKFLEVCC
jgi:hypothetical protein